MIGPGTAEATFPKIELEGVDREQAEAVAEILTEAQEHAQHIARQQAGIVMSMLRLRKPISTGRRSRAHRPVVHKGNVFDRMAGRLEAAGVRRARRSAA